MTISSRIYRGITRARACGFLVENGRVLMLKHLGLGSKGFIWAPPGGGVDFHETCESTVIKEFREETGLEVIIRRFLFANEYMDNRHHAIELFFQVEKTGGVLKLGTDPEVPDAEQILDEIKWFTFAELDALDRSAVHNAFSNVESSKNILDLKGFFNFVNISG